MVDKLIDFRKVEETSKQLNQLLLTGLRIIDDHAYYKEKCAIFNHMSEDEKRYAGSDSEACKKEDDLYTKYRNFLVKLKEVDDAF